MTNPTWRTIGSPTFSNYERERDDFYATDPIAITLLHNNGYLTENEVYWECACGNGFLSKRLVELGYSVVSTDLYDRGYGYSGIDFLEQDVKCTNIITNPPFKHLNDFIKKGIELAEHRLYIFAKLLVLESFKRYDAIWRDNPPKYVLPFVRRVSCYKDGDLDFKGKSAIAYAWFVWENGFEGNTTIDWLI